MANQFDPTNAPIIEPTQIVAGDFVQWWQKELAQDYPTSLYNLKYYARTTDNGGGEIEITASETGGEYLIQVASTVTAAYTPGTYQWQKEIIRSSDSARVVISKGQFTVTNNMADPGEYRSHSTIMLGKIESLLQGKADSDVASYTVAGRSLTKMSFMELMAARDLYKAEVRKEQAAAGIKGASSTIKVRFT
jgi:hypothetical protein